MTTSVIVAGARTPVGKLMGSLKDFSASDLGAIAIAGALEKAKVPASAVEYVIMGQVLTAGAGQLPARQAAVAAGKHVFAEKPVAGLDHGQDVGCTVGL